MKKKGILLFLVLWGAPALGAIPQDAIVKVFTVSNEYDFYRPWQMNGKQTKTGSGCIIGPNRILTNAHVVADRTFLQVKRAGVPHKFVARVAFVAHECDLAVLEVDDKRFFDGVKPLEIGRLPEIRAKVAVYGFPQGGTRIAITEGVVSRIENLYYMHSQAYLLGCQIDAAINPGSSGGPVIHNDKIVGVAFQASSGENIGYMVSTPVVQHFLKDIEDGKYDGFPSLGVSFQKMENPRIRRRFGMRDDASGILINDVFSRSPAWGILEPDDVVLSVDGCDVANDATVTFRKGGDRTFFMYPVQRRHIGDSLSLRVLRKGEETTLRVGLTLPFNGWQMVPRQQYDTPPDYFIYGGLVFVPLTRNFLTTWGSSWVDKAPKALVNQYLSAPVDTVDEVVVLGQILTDEINAGYDDALFSVITTVNDTPITGLGDCIERVDGSESDTTLFETADGYRIVVPHKEALDTKHIIFKRYKIVFDRSEKYR